MHNTKSLLATLHCAGCTHRDLKMFAREHKSPEQVRDGFLGKESLLTPWITPERREKITKNLAKYPEDMIAEKIHTYHIDILTAHDPLYPEKLLNLTNHPYLLYVRGSLESRQIMLGIVGSRASTQYGKNTLESLFVELPPQKIGIVSGGAHGIDTMAHTLALKKGIYTVSVFGSGIDIFYPARNQGVFEEILSSGGALVSQFPIGTKPEPYMFPMRNEIVAGMSNGIVIPEAGEKSGTLITAALALEQGKDVFAFPGDVFRESSRGCNLLIAKGEAKCILSASDILEEYALDTTGHILPPKERDFSSPQAKLIFEAIESGIRSPQSLSESTALSIDAVMMELALLEIDGHICLGADGSYSCNYY